MQKRLNIIQTVMLTRRIKKYDKGGRPSVEKYDTDLQLLLYYIGNNDEYQYTFPELKHLINKLSDENHSFKLHSEKSFKKTLLRYSDNH